MILGELMDVMEPGGYVEVHRSADETNVLYEGEVRFCPNELDGYVVENAWVCCNSSLCVGIECSEE